MAGYIGFGKEEKCDAEIEFGDDHGDNRTTFYCELSKGHKGKHKESGHLDSFKDGIDKIIYVLEWEDILKK